MEPGKRFRYLEHHREVYRKVFRCIWKQQTSFSWNQESLPEFSNSFFSLNFYISSTAFTFLIVEFDWHVMQSRLFYYRKELRKVGLADTLNMFVNSTEKILGVCNNSWKNEKEMQWKKELENSLPVNVMKIFLAYFLFIFSYWCVRRLCFFLLT